MSSEDTRSVLKAFGVAVTNLENALDRRAPEGEIMKHDAHLAESTREVIALVERIRSRRFE